MYKNDIVTIDILQAVQLEIDKLYDNLLDIEIQRLLNFATWYKEVFADELDCDRNITEIKQKLNTRGKVWIEGVTDICKSEQPLVQVVYKADEYSVYIITENELSDNLKTVIREYVPAHILIEYLPYLRIWQKAEPFTWEYTEKNTWNELREKMEI